MGVFINFSPKCIRKLAFKSFVFLMFCKVEKDKLHSSKQPNYTYNYTSAGPKSQVFQQKACIYMMLVNLNFDFNHTRKPPLSSGKSLYFIVG